MNYETFYKEIVNWINSCNTKAAELGFHSEAYWNWIGLSIADISERYNNNDLVKKQMVMLYEWLYEMYERSLSSGRNKNH